MEILLDIILVLFLAKLLGGLFETIRLVELLGAIIAGYLLGPVFHLVDVAHIEPFGKIGLILILFLAGFEEFNLTEILKEKVGIISTGIVGAVVPFLLGFFTGVIFDFAIADALFIGGAMAATSVSISVGTLISTRKVNTKVGRYVVAASIIDDIIGLVILIFIVGFASTGSINSVGVGIVLLKILGFAVGFAIALYVIPKFFRFIFRMRTEELEISSAIVIILLLGFVSEKLGFSSIVGAFLAGIVLSKVPALKTRIETEKFEAIALGFFAPFFFAWVGFQLQFDLSIIGVFTLVFILIGLFGKIIAAYIGGMIAKMNLVEKLAMGVAMMPRGEVALSVMLIGLKMGVVNNTVFGATFLLILVTILLTPMILKPLLNKVPA